MANVMFKKGLLANLPATYSEGTFYVTTDERAIYLDVDGSNRIRLGDFQEFASLSALRANSNPSTTALYYVSDINCLAKWDGSEYIQINLDTGMTSVEVVGDGNVVTAASYDATTRKLTLTKGISAATSAYVGTIPEGYTETNIVAYINKKAEETLNAASGGSSESAASVLAALNTYKTETDPRLEALEAVDHEHANKELLDTYKQTEADLADAVAKKHAHENAAVLDGITADRVSAWDAAEQNAKDHADKAIEDLKLAETYEPIGKGAEEAGKVSEALEAYKTSNDAAVKDAADAASAADGKAVAAQEAVDALAGKVGTVADGKTVVEMISEAQSAATYDDTALAGRVKAIEDDYLKAADKYDDTDVKADIKANADAIALLNDGSTVEGSVDYKIAQAVAAIMENPDDTMNSINELVTWINGHAEDALELSNKVSANEQDIAALEGLVGTTGVADQISAAIEAALKIDGVDKYALAADLTAAIGRIAAMEGKVANWDAAEANAKKHADDLNSAMNTRVEALEAIDHDHSNKTVLDGITAEKIAAWDGAQAAAEATAAGALASAKTELEGKITKGDEDTLAAAKTYAEEQAASAKSGAEGTAAAALASAKTELEGKISAAQAAAEKVANDNDAAMDTRVKALEDIDHEAYKGYADQAETDAVATANAYTDAQITAALSWGSF